MKAKQFLLITIFIFFSLQCKEAYTSSEDVIEELDGLTVVLPVGDITTTSEGSPKEQTTLKRAFSYDTIQLPEAAWQDFFYRCHGAGRQHFLVCGTESTLYKAYIDAIKELLVTQSECRLTVIYRQEENKVTEVIDLALNEEGCNKFGCSCTQHVFTSQESPRRKLYRELRDNHLIQSHTILRYLHFVPLPHNQDFPTEIPSPGMNMEKYSAIMLSGPRRDYKTPFHWLSHKGILYIPYNYVYGTARIVNLLVEAGFLRRHIVVTKELICASKVDPNDFPTAQFTKVKKQPLPNPLVPSLRVKSDYSIWGECNLL